MQADRKALENAYKAAHCKTLEDAYKAAQLAYLKSARNFARAALNASLNAALDARQVAQDADRDAREFHEAVREFCKTDRESHNALNKAAELAATSELAATPVEFAAIASAAQP